MANLLPTDYDDGEIVHGRDVNGWTNAVNQKSTYMGAVSSEGEMTAALADVGDFCYRTDLSNIFYLTAAPATVAENWDTALPTLPIELTGLGTDILKGNGSGGFSAAVPGTDYERPFQINVLNYGADPTGTADSTTAFNDAKAALAVVLYAYADSPSGGGWVYAPTGNYLISSTLSHTELQHFRGDGSALTILTYTGTGPCIDAANTVAPTGWPAPCNLKGFGIDGSSNSNTDAYGIRHGNLGNSWANDIQIQNFDQAGDIGLFFKNFLPGAWSEDDPYVNLPAAERLHFTGISIRNCTSAVVFDGAGINQGQFNMCVFEFEVFCSTNQNGLTFQNDALMGSSKLTMLGNFTTGGDTNTGWVLGMDVGNTAGVCSMYACELFIVVETDGTVDSLGHKTIVLGSMDFGGIEFCSGTLWFVPPVPGYATWQGMETPLYGYIFGFAGIVCEPVLGTMSFTDSFSFQGGTQRNVFDNGTSPISSGYTVVPQYGDVQELWLPNTSCAIAGFLEAPYTASRSLNFFFHQPASGATCVMTWPSNVIWIDGNDTLSKANSAVDHVRMNYLPYDDKWYAEIVTSATPVPLGETTTAASSTPIVLTDASTPVQVITGTTTAQTLSLPTTSIEAGQEFTIVNQCTGASVTVEAAPYSEVVAVLAPDQVGIFTATQDTPIANVNWVATITEMGTAFTAFPGGITLTNSGTATTYGLPAATDTLAGLTATQTLTDKTISGTSNTLSDIALTSLDSAAYTTVATASTLAERDSSANVSANNFLASIGYITAAAGTTTLTASSAAYQVIIGSTTQTVKLPTTGIPAGFAIGIENGSTGAVTVESSNGSTVYVLAPSGGLAFFRAEITTPVASTDWIVQYNSLLVASGKILTIANTLNFSGTDGTNFVFPGSSDTVAGIAATQVLSHKDLTDVTNTFPTLNQSTTGNAATATKLIPGETTTVASATPITMTSASTQVQTITGTTTAQTITLPTTSIEAGQQFIIINQCTGASVTVEAAPYSEVVAVLAPDQVGIFTATQDTPIANVNWVGSAIQMGMVFQVNSTEIIITNDGTAVIYTLPATSDTLVGRATTDALTHKDLTDVTNTFPTLNQSTTGNAATATKLQTARNINGVAFDGTAAITVTDATAEKTVNKNVANGYAGLDSGGKLPAALYPSSMDEVIEYANLAAFPGTGASQIIYVAQDTGKIYRWSGSAYIEISPSPGSTDSVPEGSVNLYYTNARADARVAVGNAATATTLQTARNIDGQAFDGSAAITVIAPGTHAATSKSTPVDADELPITDSGASYGLKKLTWANLKATVKSYYDSVASTLTNKDLTSGTNTFPTFNQNTSGTAAVANQLVPSETVTVASGTPLAMTIASTQVQVIAGTTTAQTVLLPSTSVTAGQQYLVVNQCTGASVTVQASDGFTIAVLPVNGFGIFTAAYDTPSAPYLWGADVGYLDMAFGIAPGEIILTNAGAAVTYTLPASSSTLLGAGGPLGTPSGGTLTNCGGLPLSGLATPPTAAPTASTPVEWDANKNLSANNLIEGFASTVTSATPVVLTVASAAIQAFTGSTAQTVKLPTTGVVAGQQYTIVNESSGLLTIQSSGANTITTIPGVAAAPYPTITLTALVATPTTAAHWLSPTSLQAANFVEYIGTTSVSGVAVPAGIIGVEIVAMIAPGNGGGSGALQASGTLAGGGGGGGCGGANFNMFVPAKVLGTTYGVAIPAAGQGGAAKSTIGSGNPGTAPASYSTQFTSGSFVLAAGSGNTPGQGGTNAAGGNGGNGGGSIGVQPGNPGGAGSSTTAAGTIGAAPATGGTAGGGGGGAVTATPTASAGGAGGTTYIWTGVTTEPAGGVVGGASPGAGNAAMSCTAGQGGGGGAGATSGAGQGGATALGYGGGGGGGGGSIGTSSGAGGNGGPGYLGIRWVYN